MHDRTGKEGGEEGRGDVLVVGGDLNGHLDELDECTNGNGKMVKGLMEQEELELLNSSWPGMRDPTWRGVGREYRLDLILVNHKGCAEVVEAWIGDYQDVVDSDHCMVAVKLIWVSKRGSRMRRDRKKRVPDERWSQYGQAVEEEVMTRGELDLQETMKEVV